MNLVKNVDTEFAAFKILFEDAFNAHYEGLYRYAFTLLENNHEAKDVIQSVFSNWWEKRDKIKIEQSVKGYLYSAIYKRSLNVIRHRKVKNDYANKYIRTNKVSGESTDQGILTKELTGRIQAAIDILPEQCKLIFSKSRFEEKTYAQIANDLNLSVKTVEAQMGKALKILRVKLYAVTSVLVFLIIAYINY